MLIECWQTEALIDGGHMTQQRSDRRERTWLEKATHTETRTRKQALRTAEVE
jgi:hypothetical protein